MIGNTDRLRHRVAAVHDLCIGREIAVFQVEEVQVFRRDQLGEGRVMPSARDLDGGRDHAGFGIMPRKPHVAARTDDRAGDGVGFLSDDMHDLEPERRENAVGPAAFQELQQAASGGRIDDDDLVHVTDHHVGVVVAQTRQQTVQQPPAFRVEILVVIAGQADDIGSARHLGHALSATVVDDIAVLQPELTAVVVQPYPKEEQVVAHHGHGAGGGLHLGLTN